MEVKNTTVVYVPARVEQPKAELVQAKEPQQKKITEVPEKVTKEMLETKVEGMNDFLEPTATSVKFKFHDELGEYYVQVIDTVTDEILKEIPNKKFLDMYASMAEFAGLLVDEKL